MVGGDDGDDEVPSLFEPDELPAPEVTRLAEDLLLGPRPGQKPWLLVVGGRRCVGMLFEVRPRMTLGRAEPSDVLLDEEGVSRRHAQVEVVAGGVVRVTDLDSSNGIRVGGRRVKSHPLRDGERLRLGAAVLTLVHFDDVPNLLLMNLRASVEALSKPK
jgi:pSer/pThr/pTyr-binding forkhead associated (FHA) protein